MIKIILRKPIVKTDPGSRDYTLYRMLYPIVLDLIFTYIASSIRASSWLPAGAERSTKKAARS